MKRSILAAATAAMLFSAAAASAQPNGGPYGDRDHDGRPNYAEQGRDRDHDGRSDERDRYDNRRSGHNMHRYHRGQRFEHYRSRTYIVSDYRSRGWRAPPRGYAYYRTDNGDVVLAALATGIIASIILNGR